MYRQAAGPPADTLRPPSPAGPPNRQLIAANAENSIEHEARAGGEPAFPAFLGMTR